MSKTENILLFVNITLFLIVHNLKIRRFASDNFKKILNSIFSGAIFLVMILLLKQIIWNSKILIYIDVAIILIIIVVISLLLVKHFNSLKEAILKAFETKISIFESVVMIALITAGFIYDFLWFFAIGIFIFFLLREAYYMSDLRKIFSKNDQ